MSDRGTSRSETETRLDRLARRHSTATVLFHHAMAERLGLGPSDHKCLDLLLQHEEMTGSRLAALTGLTTGAITGVVNRLEQAGYVRRRPDPSDGRRQLLQPVAERVSEVAERFAEHGPDHADLLAGMDPDQVAAVTTYLVRATDHLEQRAALLRANKLSTPPWPDSDPGGRRSSGTRPASNPRQKDE
jgi:DNA-binding MarR family transcriptional regulator